MHPPGSAGKIISPILQIVKHVADAALPAIGDADPASFTAATLQFAATNVSAAALPELYTAAFQRALELLPTLSLQQAGDIAWALRRAQLPDAQIQALHVAIRSELHRALDLDRSPGCQFAGSMARSLGVRDRAPSREQMHAMANALQRLCKAGTLRRSDAAVHALYGRIIAGVQQVMLS